MKKGLKNLDKNYKQSRPILDNITIIIPTLGRPILETCLQSIVDGSCWPGQIIVVDQSSSQRIGGWIRTVCSFGMNAKHVPSSQRGKAAALNLGIEQTKTRFVAITDDDCFVERHWLREMNVNLLQNPEAIITGPAIAEGPEKVVAEVNSLERVISERPRLKFDLFCGSNMGVAMTVIKRVGFFDEDSYLLNAEDCEWAYRALRSSVPIIYLPKIKVRHHGWRNLDLRYTRYEAYAQSHGGFYGKYLCRGDWFIAIRVVIHHIRAFRRWLKGIITGNQELTANGRAYITGLLPGIIAFIRRSNHT
jgi:glycosyltransferase involved in cell wall biosynthesis